MAVRRCSRLLGALCAVVLTSPLGNVYVLAGANEPNVEDPALLQANPADAPAADAIADAIAAEGESTEEGSLSGELTEEQQAMKAEAFVDSARDLNDKLAQLKALLAAKGEGADPGLTERLSKLQDQLTDLGIDGLGGGGGTSSPELTEFIQGCVVLSMRRAGVRKPATIAALRTLSEGKLTPEEASGMELYRMAVVCIQEFTQDEVELFKAGKMKELPRSYVELSNEPKVTELVIGLEAQYWEALKTVATQLVKEMTGDSEKEKPPIMMGLVAGVPVLCGVGFLFKKFFDMQARQDKEKADKAAKKKSK